jgi:hypothetical protein
LMRPLSLLRTSDAARRAKIVLPVKLHPGDLFNFADQFVVAKIDSGGNEIIAVHDHVDALEAIVYIHEAPRGGAVSPDVDFARTSINSLNDLPADCCRRFFASAVPGAVRAVNVVESRERSDPVEAECCKRKPKKRRNSAERLPGKPWIMWVLMRMLRRHSTRYRSIKPIPPISAARL